MQSRRRLLHRAVVAALVVLAVVATGCSMVGPESSWSGNEGSLTGVVRSTQGYALAGIDVRVRTEVSEGDWIQYDATTDAAGVYRLTGVELGQAHAYEKDYTIYVNRSTSSASPIVSGYGTYVASVPISVGGTDYDVTITVAAPGTPDGFIE